MFYDVSLASSLAGLNTFRAYCRQNQSNPAYEIKANEDLYKHGLYVLAAIKVCKEPFI
jgi:hypothetical protein